MSNVEFKASGSPQSHANGKTLWGRFERSGDEACEFRYSFGINRMAKRMKRSPLRREEGTRMEQIKETINASIYFPYPFKEYLEGLSLAFFDIETTGLSPETSKFILGGLLIPDEQGLTICQYFAESRREEKELLEAYSEALALADVLITYNGHRFDLPFLRRRLAANRLPALFDPCQSLDLYRVCHLYSPLRQFLPNLKQKTLEEFLGLAEDRIDEISGAESVTLYNTYCRSGDPALKKRILLHNRDDVVQLSRLPRVIDKLDPHRILCNEGFAVALDEKRCFTGAISFRDRLLTVTGHTRNVPSDYYAFESGFQTAFRSREQVFTLEFPVREVGSDIFVDLELLPLNLSTFEEYPGFQSGYLILKNSGSAFYREINVLVKEMLKFILNLL